MSKDNEKIINDAISLGCSAYRDKESTTFTCDELQDVVSMIENSLSGRWISVDEKLPTKCGLFLTLENGVRYECRFFDTETGKWSRPAGVPFGVNATSHWMVLPELPSLKSDPVERLTKTTFKKKLRGEREKRRLSQNNLSDLSGINASAISHFETGKRLPSLNNIIKLCKGLGCEPNDLINDLIRVK